MDIAHASGWRYRFAPHKIGTPVIGHITGKNEAGEELLIEVLNTIWGVTRKELENTVDIERDGRTYRILSPIIMLKAKVANAVDFDQTTRGDVRHVQILIHCVREFIRDAHRQALQGAITERGD